ncbi:MAG: SsrA-binding protein SmpB [Acidobacteria bacterium]|nr:SsrA-binding protein SmpB [Acidobacteriota bacterium]MCW5969819.1 SsrA-binding protein SmpB [Blastocatellales bacterium]
MTEKIITTNRAAFHDYHILETYEAGIELTGTEVKSARDGRVNLKDAYARIEGGQAWLLNAHISPYTHGNRQNHEPTRERRLLLHKREIERLRSRIDEKGLTIIPIRFYLKNRLIKCELAVARGKKLYDKRETEARRDQERAARAAIKKRSVED